MSENEPDCGKCEACCIHYYVPGDGITQGGFELPPWTTRMFLCSECGNKRCPHATDHRLACTGSNESNQPGSSYQQRYFFD